MLYVGSAGSSWLMNHIRCCANDSGIRAGLGSALVIGASAAPRPMVATISSRTLGASKMSRTDTSTPSTSAARAARRIADSELPPMSKNDSVTPTRSTPSRSAYTCASATSVSDSGATYSASISAKSGSGSAFRSSLPAEFRVMSSRTTHTVGTMYTGSDCSARDFTVSTSGRRPGPPDR